MKSAAGFSSSAVRSMVLPAVVGATAAGGIALLLPSNRAGCAGDAAMDCLGQLWLATVVGIPAMVIMAWAVLAWLVGAWRAPVITFAGGATAVYSSGWVRPHLDGVPVATLIGGLAFLLVAIACLPGLRWPVRMIPIACSALICVAGLMR